MSRRNPNDVTFSITLMLINKHYICALQVKLQYDSLVLKKNMKANTSTGISTYLMWLTLLLGVQCSRALHSTLVVRA